MPAFVGGFAAFFTGATVVGVAATLGFLTAAVVFNAALGAIARKLTSRKESDPGQRFQREVTVRATDAYDVFVYGRALVGGVTVYHNGIPDSDGVNNRMHHVVKWAGHECTSIELFRLDHRTLHPTSDSINWNPVSYSGNGLVGSGEFRGVAAQSGPTYMRWYLGNQNSADARLAQQATEWTNSHVGNAQTYGVLEIWQVDGSEQTSKVYQKGFPQNIAAHIHGKKVYDHRRYALNRDPKFLNTASWWTTPEAGTITTGLPDDAEVVEGIGGPFDRGIQITDNEAVGTDEGVFTEFIPCDPASAYTGFATMRRTIGDRPVIMQAQWWTADASSRITVDNVLSDQVPAVWSSYFFTLTPAASSALMRFGFNRISSGAAFTANTTQIQIQDMGIYLGTGSRHLVDVASTWEYSESPPFCVADYLTDERLGFGKRLRIPINPSRYARNADPTWRRLNTLDVRTYWLTNPVSGGGATLASAGPYSLNVALTGAPVGRRALVAVASDGSAAVGEQFFSSPVAIDPSGQYFISVQARQDGAKAAYLAVAFLDGNGENITGNSSSDATGWPNRGTYHYFHVNAPLASTWSNYLIAIGSGATASIPSCASFLSIGALCVRSFGANGDTAQYFQEYQVHVGTTIRHFIEPHEQIFWPSVSSAAAYTDAIVATTSGDQVRFACNGAGHTGAGHRENVRDLLSSFNGRCIYVQSGFWITAGWEEPTKTLNKSDFRSEGSLKVRAKAEISDRYNHVRGTFYDEQNEYKRVPMATVTAAEYIARDSSQQLFHDTHLPFTNDWFMAQRVAFGILEQGDNQQLVEFQLKHSALDLMPGRVVAINNDVVSWTNHTLRMVDMETDLKKGVKLFAKEDYSASYVDPSTSEYYARTVNEVTSKAPIVPQVSSVTVTPRDGGVQLHWMNPAARSFEWIDIYRRTTNAFSGSTLIKSTRNDEHVDALQAGQTQFYWFRSRDFAGNVSSIYPGLTSSFSGAGLFPVSRDPEYVFFDEFRYQSVSEFQQKWEPFVGSGNITFINTGTVGGRVLQSSGAARWVSRTRIPYDDNALYQMRAKVRLTNSVDANRAFSAGFVGYRADGTTPINVNSLESTTGQHYFVRNNQNLNSLGLWVEYTGHVRGHMPWPTSGTVHDNLSQDPKFAARMHDRARYVAPVFILNETSGGNTAQIDYMSVRKIQPNRTIVFDRDVTLESNWLGGNAYNDTTSFHFFTSYPEVGFTKTNLGDQYGVAHLNVRSATLGNAFYVMHERLRIDFHTKFAEANSIAFNWQAAVFASSHGGLLLATVAPSAFVVTKQGSLAARGQATAGIEVPAGEWRTVRGTITLSNSSINTNSYPGPYFVVPGLSARITGAPTSYALATLYMDRIG